ncbi:GDP-mannose 4,6-dehydratase [Xylanimonas protaetiae]|uniref:GDP-mannose 4,6-dehydratase n=1 Tax=Xylanimonas protaetiae TaxID=2509457 RepID=A0A4P6F4A3_9MICO|nr:GDP-mannose 4,6-dehydratase [Xylanimonas protaetiae]QAY69039.1 GDP-mannose 4,6-dehydratase [Xylanimonas protaetiae]
MTRVLITGVTGQDGSYLAERLVAEGHEVHGVVLPSEVDVPLAEGVERHVADLAEIGAVGAVVSRARPDAVYNLAGISSVALSWREPELTARVTGGVVAELLAAVREVEEGTGREVRFLQASSAEIFGAPETWPQTEATPVAPVTPYGAAKAFAHHLVQVFRGTGMHASNVILYNHESPRRPTTFVTRKITSNVARIAVRGTGTLALGNLAAVRDWGWAPDYVDAMVRALEHDLPGDYVVATGESRTVGDFVRTSFEHVGIQDWESHVVVDTRLLRAADAPTLVGDATRAHDVLGWKPMVAFEDLVCRMVDADLERVRAEHRG